MIIVIWNAVALLKAILVGSDRDKDNLRETKKYKVKVK
jgi:hypothetical protein